MSESIKIALCRHALAAGACLKLRIRGTSMLPALWPGDSIWMEPTNVADLRLGQVIVFARDRDLVAHRIVGFAADADGLTLTTRGDAQFHDDRPVHAAEVLGVARAVRRFGADRPLAFRPSLAARAISSIVRSSETARFLLSVLHSRLPIESAPAQRVRIAPWISR